MQALASHTKVPVPRTATREDARDVLGAPFLIMDRVEGLTLADDPPYTAGGWIHDATPAVRRQLNENALRVLVDLHHRGASATGMHGLDPYTVVEYVADLTHYFAWAADAPNPVIEAGLTWLGRHLPADDQEPCLIW